MQDARGCGSNTRRRIGIYYCRRTVVLAVLLACGTVWGDDALWVDNPQAIAYSVGTMTVAATGLGLSNEHLVQLLRDSLQHAGLTPRESAAGRDEDVLFLDVVVQDESYYASVGFWRNAGYPLPDGSVNSELVIVWQDYAVGTHGNDAAAIRETVSSIIGRFIVRYSDANDLVADPRVAATP